MKTDRSNSSILAALILAALTTASNAQAQVQELAAQAAESPQSEPTEFLRLREVDGEPQALETAVVTYESSSPGGVQVDLIGAVHIGESSYYAELNQLFDRYDVVLYELVAPEGTQIPKGGKRGGGSNPISMLQDGAKNILGLESQLELVDYTKPHFVRADMTPEQISLKMAERGDTAVTLALSALTDVMRQANRESSQDNKQALAELEELSLFDMLGNPLKMKRVMAQQFASTGSLDKALGNTLNQLLIVDRNAEALRGLQKQIAQGKKRIGIFYGAAHLPDLEKHLVEDFGLRKAAVAQTAAPEDALASDAGSTRLGSKPALSGNESGAKASLGAYEIENPGGNPQWIKAWDLKRAKQTPTSEPVSLLLNLLEALDL